MTPPSSLFARLRTVLVPAACPLATRCYDGLAFGMRLIFGYQFFLAGKGKLLNLEATGRYFESLQLPAPSLFALSIASLETVGGLLLLTGLLTRLQSFLLAGAMGGALLTAHREELKEGLDGLFGAAPFPYLVAVLFLFVVGPGRWSLDALLAPRFAGKTQDNSKE